MKTFREIGKRDRIRQNKTSNLGKKTSIVLEMDKMRLSNDSLYNK